MLLKFYFTNMMFFGFSEISESLLASKKAPSSPSSSSSSIESQMLLSQPLEDREKFTRKLNLLRQRFSVTITERSQQTSPEQAKKDLESQLTSKAATATTAAVAAAKSPSPPPPPSPPVNSLTDSYRRRSSTSSSTSIPLTGRIPSARCATGITAALNLEEDLPIGTF